MTLTLPISNKKIKTESCDSQKHAETIRDNWKEKYAEEMKDNEWEIFLTVKSKNEMREEQKEKLGQLIDRIESLAVGVGLTQLPDSIHMQGLRGALPEISEKLKEVFIEITVENPWE